MKQVLQSYRSGSIEVADVPVPALRAGGVLVRTRASLLSSGTELALVRQSRGTLIGRASARPRAVGRLLSMARGEGIGEAINAVRDKLSSAVQLGYSCSGDVVAVGSGVREFCVSQRVACAGSGYATHAEVNFVPCNLCVALPDGVSYEQGAFVALGAIAMQGIRQAAVSLGDVVAVIGLGLIGQITVQLLRASGACVVATDLLEQRRCRAEAAGCITAQPGEVFLEAVRACSSGYGADAVIITAATKSNEVVIDAAHAARARARLVIVGDVGMDLPRSPFYEKELDVRFSMSYGPGRYDPDYEQHGRDYPYSLVRWTERRNMSAVLELAAAGRIDLSDLVTHRFDIDQAPRAYELLESRGGEALGIVIRYPRDDGQVLSERKIELPRTTSKRRRSDVVRLGMIGAGQFARKTLLPAMRAAGRIELGGLATATGPSAAAVGKLNGFAYCTCDAEQVIADDAHDGIVIATRHDLHAELAAAALSAGKWVFVEKPLALDMEQLQQVARALADCGGAAGLLVGHNRRFSPAAKTLRETFASRSGPMVLNYRVNAGPLPHDHWVRRDEGGGRWLAEGSHFVDFAVCLAGQLPSSVFARSTRSAGASQRGETWAVVLAFPDSSLAQITYCDLGDPSCGKEMCEVFADGVSACLDDFRKLTITRGGKRRSIKLDGDKGHRAQMRAFVEAVAGGVPPVTHEQQLAVARCALAAVESASLGRAIELGG